MRYNSEEYQRNKKQYLERQSRYRGGENREKYLEKARIQSREWYLKNKEKRYEYNRKMWQIKVKKMEEIAGRQRPKKCEICGCDGVIVFDHDHSTGKFRGWICERCNTVLGKVQDGQALLNDLIVYLDNK